MQDTFLSFFWSSLLFQYCSNIQTLRLHENSGVSLCKYRSHRLLRSSDGVEADTDKYFYRRKEGRTALRRGEWLKAHESPEGLISNPRLHAWYLGNTGAEWPPKGLPSPPHFTGGSPPCNSPEKVSFVPVASSTLLAPLYSWVSITSSLSRLYAILRLVLWQCLTVWGALVICHKVCDEMDMNFYYQITHYVELNTSLWCNSKYYDSECKNITFLDMVVGGNYDRF